MEQKLMQQFQEERKQGKIRKKLLFLSKTRKITREEYLSNIAFNPAGNYMFKVNNRDTRTRCEIWRRSGVFIGNFEYISHLVLVFLLLTCFYCKLRRKTHIVKNSPATLKKHQKFHVKLLREQDRDTFQLGDIANLDQMPLSFVLDDGRPYAKGAEEVWYRSGASGLDE